MPTSFIPQVPTQIPTFQQVQGEKRILSPNATPPNKTQDDKRQRNGSTDMEEGLSTTESDQGPTMTDLKTAMDAILTRLNTTATKVDIASINDKIMAQNLEIDQLKTKMGKHEEDMKKLQSLFDESVAANLNRKPESADRRPRMQTNNMASTSPNRYPNQQSKRRNLIIEGLGGESEEDMCVKLIELCESIDVTLYKSEIEYITRFKRREGSVKRPGPVLVTISRIVVRDNILCKKNVLKDMEGKEGIFINADETLDVRRAKSTLRKVARITKQQGIEIEFRHDRIFIEGVWYTTDDVNKIPSKYMPLNEDDRGAVGGKDKDLAENPIPGMEKREQLIKRGEKMRITKVGLCFSGPTAYPSNMHYAPIAVKDKVHDSNEQCFQYDKAKEHGCDELAETIKGLDDPYEIKRESNKITTTTEWDQASPDKLWDLMEKKYHEHPELLERLIETAPLPLIEASKDMRWGGGGPLSFEIVRHGRVSR